MQLHRRAFTLIELLVVITLIAVLSTALLVGANALKRKAAQAQTAAFIGDLTTALIHLSTNDGSLPQPDNGSFIRYDPDLDLADTTELKDYATWPVMNKVLLSGTMASFDRARFLEPGLGQTRAVTDAWRLPLRYVIGDGTDDRGNQPQGSRSDWNWDLGNNAPLVKNYPYVYSFGPDGLAVSGPEHWIIAGEH